MKNLLNYINDSNIIKASPNVNEGFFDSVRKFFKWLTSSDENDYDEKHFMYTKGDDVDEMDNYIEDNLSTENIVSETYDKPKHLDIIKNLIAKVKSNVKKKTGFWVALEDIEKDSSYSNIGGPPWFVKYVTFTFKTNKVLDPCGLICFSRNYHSATGNKDYEDFIHILSVQTLKRYKGNHLLRKCYIPYFKKISENNTVIEGITLRPYDDSLKEMYLKYGFMTDPKDSTLLIKRF